MTFCPMIKAECLQDKCAWWVPDICVLVNLNVIADILVEGTVSVELER